MKLWGALFFSVLLYASDCHAQRVDAPELCPDSAEAKAMNIKILMASKNLQNGAWFVNCLYQKQGAGPVDEIAFRVLCPAGTKIVSPGYLLSKASRTNLRVTGLVATAGSSEDFVLVGVFPAVPTEDLDLEVFALCR